MAKTRRKRRGFVRQEVSRAEKALCIAILGLVGGIAGAVVVRGELEKGHLWGGWDKNRYTPPASSEAGVVSMAPPMKPASSSSGATSSPAPSPAQALLTPDLAGPAWSGGQAESFPADRLWEKIDGHAELFLQYEVVSLEAITYQSNQDKNLTIEVNVYNMGQPLMAFGVYSSERPLPLKHPVQVGQEGYEDGGIFFWKGPYYTTIIPAVVDNPSVNQAMQKIAQQLADKQPDDPSPIWGKTAFPAQGQVPYSLKYLHRDALGVDFMPGVYTAQYGSPDYPIEVFLTDRGSSQTAQGLFEKYVEFLGTVGKVSSPHQEGEATVVVCDMGGLFDFAFRRGSLLGGVKAAPDRAAGEAQLKFLLKNLPRVAD